MSLTGCASDKNALNVLASDGEAFATVKSDRAVRKSNYKAYLEIVVEEAVEIIAEIYKMEDEQARKELYGGGYTLYTAFDKEINANLSKACFEKQGETEVAAAITDLEANLLAVYSGGNDKKGVNLATANNPPCSSFKPLSVYAPAIDKGVINWSSRYEDSPYKYVKSLEGVMRPWPSNSTEVYSERYAYIYQAVAESLNTVAVKCLSDYGIENSINFLEENFEIPLNPEKTTAKTKGYEEVMGNIALGFLSNGVSAVDMAGYYQIFANGGKYESPKTVLKICDSSGDEIYHRGYSQKQVIKDTTAEIMNRMLKEVLSSGGTGEKARTETVEAAGKTGTDDNGQNNWFVGVTPEYSLAFWHGYNDKNFAAEIFSHAVDTIYGAKTKYQKTFVYKSGVKEVIYCTESAKQFKPDCSFIRTGYYTQEKMPGICDRH